MSETRTRPVTPTDARAIAAIYAHHVLHGTATFDTDPPTPEDWASKINSVGGRGWPFLVAERDGAILGYAYATQFRDRAAYSETCENSIYVDARFTGQGIGSSLLAALLEASAGAGFRQMIAVIGGGESSSVALHAKFGFIEAGRMREVGRKFGRLLNTVYMQVGL